jgi:hypothetical protein
MVEWCRNDIELVKIHIVSALASSDWSAGDYKNVIRMAKELIEHLEG